MSEVEQNLKNELDSQKEVSIQAGNPQYESILNLEESIKTQMDQIGKKLKDSFIKEISDNNKLLEDRLNDIIAVNNQVIKESNISYTDAVKNVMTTNGKNTVPHIEGNVDFQTVMREAQNEQLAMENDKRSRANNLILLGVAELINCDGQQAKQHDEDFIKTLIATLGLNVTHKLVHRLGKRDPANEQSKRPMKLVMLNEEDKDRLLDNLKTLKGNEIYKGISVTSDHTI